VGSSSNNRSGGPAPPATREFAHLLVGGEFEIRNRLFDTLLDVPAVVGVDLRVQCFEVPQALLVEFEL
jgi:hypothetical protein